MKHPHIADLYSDYLLSSFSLSTATGLSNMLDGAYSHDQISRFLAQPTLGQKDYWKSIKPIVRKVENDHACICIDDVITEKEHSTMNDIINYHYDHTKGKSVKGINMISFLYHSNFENGNQTVELPLAFEIVLKPIKFTDLSTGKEKRRSEISKNELVRDRLKVLTQRNHVLYRYALWDSWFSSNDNFKFVHHELKKYFIGALKSNRLVALSKADKLQGKFVKVDALDIQPGCVREVWIKGLDFTVQLSKLVYTNKDSSTGVLYLVSNDKTLTYEQQDTIYQKRWKVEEFHKSIKQNACLATSPTKYEVTQSNHIFMVMIGFAKLEMLKLKTAKNHFAIKAKLYLKAVKAAYEELNRLKIEFRKVDNLRLQTMPLLH